MPSLTAPGEMSSETEWGTQLRACCLSVCFSFKLAPWQRAAPSQHSFSADVGKQLPRGWGGGGRNVPSRLVRGGLGRGACPACEIKAPGLGRACICFSCSFDSGRLESGSAKASRPFKCLSQHTPAADSGAARSLGSVNSAQGGKCLAYCHCWSWQTLPRTLWMLQQANSQPPGAGRTGSSARPALEPICFGSTRKSHAAQGHNRGKEQAQRLSAGPLTYQRCTKSTGGRAREKTRKGSLKALAQAVKDSFPESQA